MKEVNLTINGVKKQFTVEPDYVLLDLLREDLGLTGAKQSCDRKGQCGACMVIVDGKAVHSCLKKVVDLEGASVITVEGLGTPHNPHLIQEAYVLSGAVQCGYCTPGMIMATKVLLDKNPDPDDAAIKRALARNLCRCTGYTKIIDAVKLAARFLRNETTPDEYRQNIEAGAMGVSHPRPSSILKACGVAQFTGDIKMPGMIELALVHSTEHHAIIKSIDTRMAEKMPGVIGIMRPEDIKGTNRIRVIVPDQPVLCEDKVRILGDPLVAVAAETRVQARAAAAAVKVQYEPLPVMLTPAEALAPDAPQIHTQLPNLCFSQPLIKGDAEAALGASAAVVAAEFSTQMNHQAPLEPEACVAYLDGEGENARLVVIGRSINIHSHAAQIKEAVGWENIRYKEAYSGGQFGIKAAVTSEAVTAAAAMHFKRPVRYIPSLQESIITTSKRHPYEMKLKLAADAQGHITAYENDFTINKGAYTILGPMAISRSLHMLSGSYHIPNINALGKLVYTNNGYGGAARGAGPPQTIFALESAVDMLAEKLEIDPLEFRRRNSLQPGGTKATGMVAAQWPFPEVCDAIKPHYDRAKKEVEAFNQKNDRIKRGVGIAAMSFGIGGNADRAKLAVEVDPDDGITIYAAVADPGEGNESMLAQIAAHALEMPLEKVRLYTRDTEKTFPAGPSAGSRQTWMAGGALMDAIQQMKEAMEAVGSKTYEGLQKTGKPTRYEGRRKNKGELMLDPKTGQGDSFLSECHNLQMVEAEVNTETGAVVVNKITTVVDAGPVIHPQNLEGQLEGGMDQGVGYALREEYVHGKTKDYVSFKFPTMRTAFKTEIITLETPRIGGPLGATGIGEMTMVSTAPAVINAIYNACGARIFDLPATPAKVKAAIEARNKTM
ncbi:MAG: molybdopterin-dependent oxidoreductase [Deltaproteobacteria bacterium]|nr:molybdopterin-dependent oxidoreductase [Deltaproteobacteria bacterium]